MDTDPPPPYFWTMNVVRRTFDLDPGTDARLREMSASLGREEGEVIAEAVALLDAVGDLSRADVVEDRRRLDAFRRKPEAVALADVRAWVESWNTPGEDPRPDVKPVG
jgi:hypothetical protein